MTFTFVDYQTNTDIRGEIARKEYGALLGLKKQVIRTGPDKLFMAIVQIQSGKLLF